MQVKHGMKVTIYHCGRLRDGVVGQYAKKRSKNRGEPWWWIHVMNCPEMPEVMKPEVLLVKLKE